MSVCIKSSLKDVGNSMWTGFPKVRSEIFWTLLHSWMRRNFGTYLPKTRRHVAGDGTNLLGFACEVTCPLWTRNWIFCFPWPVEGLQRIKKHSAQRSLSTYLQLQLLNPLFSQKCWHETPLWYWAQSYLKLMWHNIWGYVLLNFVHKLICSHDSHNIS